MGSVDAQGINGTDEDQRHITLASVRDFTFVVKINKIYGAKHVSIPGNYLPSIRGIRFLRIMTTFL